MKRKLFTFLFFLCCLQFQLAAQTPNLPTKATLNTQISANHTFTNSTQRDILTLPFAPTGDYSLEVKAQVTSAIGRGFDVDTRSGLGLGFRTSINATSFSWTSPLNSAQVLTGSDNATEQTFRYAVKGNNVHIYQNGIYIASKPLISSKDINDSNVEVDPPVIKGSNLISNWSNTTGNPTATGWGGAGGTFNWNTTNSGSGIRFLDVNATTNKHTYNGNTYIGRIMFIRWDSNTLKDGTYTYPVTLEANKSYNFSFLYGYWSNAQGSRSINVGISKLNDGTGIASSKTFSPGATQGELNRGDFSFTATDAGQYYLTFKGAWALYSITDLALNETTITPQLIIGKNYLDGAINMATSSVTYEDGAFAPVANTSTNPRQTVTLSGNTVNVPLSFDTDFTIAGKTDVHLTGDPSPFVNSSVAINFSDAWLFFDNVKPSVVISNWLDKVTINGQPASTTNARISMYANGTVIIPYNHTDQTAATFYTDENYSGDSKSYETFTRNINLAEFDNRFKSFKLKRGYMATIGSSANGIGFSKVYIADMHDIEIPVMPKGLYAKTSFIRVLRWDYVSKKGWAGGAPGIANITWNYDWNIGGNSSANTQYVTIRQNGGWPDFNEIYNKPNVNTLLGFNEPDHTDQANMTVDQAIEQWPQLMKSGFRLGSPAPSAPDNGNNWLKRFMDKADSLNYRVDIAAVHCYWNSRVSGGKADSWYSGLNNAFNGAANKRPIWITEWNNGANWTGESWPTTINDALAKQAADLPLILQVLDSTSVVERYAIYNWVEDKRAMILADTLTPAGKIYAANKSQLAYTSDPAVYKPASMYNHEWRISAPILRYTLSSDSKKAVLNWLDINGDLGTKYILERKLTGESNFTQIAEFNYNVDYPEGSNMIFEDNITSTSANYRIYAMSYEGNQSWYSAILTINVDAPAVAPVLTAEALSSTKIKLDWAPAANARSYNLKRSGSVSGPFVTIGAILTGTTYTDENLTPNTTYYYTISSVNTSGESADATPTAIATKALAVPTAVQGIHVASGDKQVVLTWNFAYDAVYDISKSSTENGVYTTIAADVNTTRYTDAGLTNNQVYYYKITPKNSEGNGAASIALQAQPILGQHLNISFDENTGINSYDSWGAYHASLKDGATWSTGKTSAAVTLSANNKSYIQLENGVVSTLNDFTIASWIKLPANQGNNTRLFDFGSGTGTFMILVPKTATGMRYKITCAKGSFDIYAPVTLPTEEWVHVAISQEGTLFKFFVNGAMVASGTNTNGINPSDMGVTTTNYLGRSQWPSDPYSDHTYDDFTIYNYALSNVAVNNLYLNILPIKLVSYKVTLQMSGEVALNWDTQHEVNNSYFIIERSSDGKVFHTIQEIPSKENGNSLGNSYFATDKTPANGYNYYRLIQVDKDGSREDLGIKSVNVSLEGMNTISLYPNPLKGEELYISLNQVSEKTYEVEIYDLSGRNVFKQALKPNGNKLDVVLKEKLNPGVYTVKVNGAVLKLLVL